MPRQFDDLMLGSIELFCLAVEQQSFTRAAKVAGLTPAAVSRSVARLEARLGVQLFARTTRRLRITDSGQAYFERCRHALDEIGDAEREIAGEQRLPSGTVRLSLPTSYGHYRILPLLPALRAQYPGIALDIELSNRNTDFTADGFDLAVRARTAPDSGLIARKLEDAELVIVATPAYLEQHGIPESPDALAAHECIQFLLPSTGQPVPWLLRQHGKDVALSTKGSFRCLDDILGPATLVRAGAGLLQTYRFIVEEDLKRGDLRQVLSQCDGASRPFSLLFPANRHMPHRVRVTIEFLVSHLGGGTSV